MTKFRRKTTDVEAVQYTVDNVQEVKDFVGSGMVSKQIETLFISTPSMLLTIVPNDWVVKGEFDDKFYTLTPENFSARYEAKV